MSESELLETILNRLDLIYTLGLVAFGFAVVGLLCYILYHFVIDFM